MAGRGPAPKPAAQRRRRNARPDDRSVPAAGNAGDFPPLPSRYRVAISPTRPPLELRFLSATKAWYEAWCTSPMATEWTMVHFLRLQQIAILQDRWTRTGDLDFAKELRLQLAGFGGTPADLRRIGVTIDQPAAPEPARRPRSSRSRGNLFAVPTPTES